MPEANAKPESLFLVRSTLEMVAVMKRLYPAYQAALCEIEQEVRCNGELLLLAGSPARARVALENLHCTRLKLQCLDRDHNRLVA